MAWTMSPDARRGPHRNRSDSRRLSHRRRTMKAPTPQHSAEVVQVFSRTANRWCDGELKGFVQGSFAQVEYTVGEYLLGKTLHVHSDHLFIPDESVNLADEDFQIEHDPEAFGLPGTLREYFEQMHINQKKKFRFPEKIKADSFEGSMQVLRHLETGVIVLRKPLRIVDEELQAQDQQILFHYTQQESFRKIVNNEAKDGSKGALLKASSNLAQDCDFGVGVYATEKGPDEFNGITGILLNNYPRRGPWGGEGKPTEKHHDLAAYCIPLVVPRCFTLSYPLTEGPDEYGPILETQMRQGHAFDPRSHNIYVIQNDELGCNREIADAGQYRQLKAQLSNPDPMVRCSSLRELSRMYRNGRLEESTEELEELVGMLFGKLCRDPDAKVCKLALALAKQISSTDVTDVLSDAASSVFDDIKTGAHSSSSKQKRSSKRR